MSLRIWPSFNCLITQTQLSTKSSILALNGLCLSGFWLLPKFWKSDHRFEHKLKFSEGSSFLMFPKWPENPEGILRLNGKWQLGYFFQLSKVNADDSPLNSLSDRCLFGSSWTILTPPPLLKVGKVSRHFVVFVVTWPWLLKQARKISWTAQ